MNNENRKSKILAQLNDNSTVASNNKEPLWLNSYKERSINENKKQ